MCSRCDKNRPCEIQFAYNRCQHHQRLRTSASSTSSRKFSPHDYHPRTNRPRTNRPRCLLRIVVGTWFACNLLKKNAFETASMSSSSESEPLGAADKWAPLLTIAYHYPKGCIVFKTQVSACSGSASDSDVVDQRSGVGRLSGRSEIFAVFRRAFTLA